MPHFYQQRRSTIPGIATVCSTRTSPQITLSTAISQRCTRRTARNQALILDHSGYNYKDMFRQTNPESTVSDIPEWSIHVTDHSRGVAQRNVIWSGRANTCPSAAVLSDILNQSLPEGSIEEVAVQVSKMAPPKSVAALLTCLSCTYWRTPSPKSAGIIDVKRLQTLSETASRSVCGKVFAQGDIVWTCRQCGKDPTCVQCDQCFRKSDHVGHEVYFHRAAGGGSGCCDCGDEEAWCRAGNCLDHNHPSRDHHGPANPLEGVPPELERGFRTVVRGALGVVTSYVICTVRGFAPLEQNTFVEEVRQRKDSIVVRLHNDDVHTYDDVTGALHAFGLTQQAGAQLTAKVDKEGEATILTESNPESSKLSAAQALFVDRVGLLMSMTPQSVVQLEPRVAAVLEWFQSMGALSDGLRRVISEELVAELTSTAQCFPDAAGADAAQVEAVNQKYSASRAFEDATQFPSVMLHLLKLPDSLDLVAPVDVNPQSESEAPLESTALSAPPEPNSEYSEAYAERLRHPFRHCHPDALALLLVASPYLANSLKAAINDLVIQYQHDAVFKATFSQQFTTLYPALCVLYCRGVGTADRTIFHMSVQVYTANSVVTMMSSDGAQPGAALRLLPEGQRPLMALPLLAATLQTALLETGCLTVSASATATAAQRAAFLTNHTIRTHRLSHLCRDVEYLSADPGFCTRLLAEDVDKGLVSSPYFSHFLTVSQYYLSICVVD